MKSKIIILIVIIGMILTVTACEKEYQKLQPKESTVPTETTKTNAPDFQRDDKNEFTDIKLFEGKWLSENQTEIVYDSSEGWAIEESIPDYNCTLNITEIEDEKVEVYINFTSDSKKTLNDTFIVAFDKNGRTHIDNVSEQIKSIDLDLLNKGYLIHAAFNFEDEQKFINFVSEEMLGKINRCMETIRDKLGLGLNRGTVDGEDIIIGLSSVDDSGILINVIRAEDTVVRGRYLFNPATLEYENVTN